LVNATESFKAIIWGEEGSKVVDLGDIAGLTGLEVNFWMQPVRLNDYQNMVSVLKLFSFIDIAYHFYLTPTQSLGNAMVLRYAGKAYNATFPVTTPFNWINVNLRVQFATYIVMSGWIGSYNIETAPDFSVTHPNPQAFTVAQLELMNMTADLYAYLAEIRVFELDSTQSWGQYFKYYQGVWPAGFESARQYVTGYEGKLYLDITNT
jgi:hypothetical protein